MTRRMLIVEDELDIVDCLREFFSLRGFSVASTFSGEEALTWLKERSVDIILLDILLPGVTGIEVLKRVKALYPHARVVMVTALDDVSLREEAERYGAYAFITKPFDFSDGSWDAVLR